MVIPKQYATPSDFENGLAKVRQGDFKTGTEMYIDKTGKVVWRQK